MQQQQAQMTRLAAEQGSVKKSIEDLSREQKESDAGRKKAIEDLKKIADEMQDVISDMKTKGVRPETVQRQERILSRLLQTERSIHERDKDETREAKGANDVTRQSPPDLDPNSEDSRRAIRDDMLNKKESIYSKDYQALIRKYLEKLGNNSYLLMWSVIGTLLLFFSTMPPPKYIIPIRPHFLIHRY